MFYFVLGVFFFYSCLDGFIDMVFLSKVELYSNDTRTSSYGRSLLLCYWKHHGGVWRVLGSTANV